MTPTTDIQITEPSIDDEATYEQVSLPTYADVAAKANVTFKAQPVLQDVFDSVQQLLEVEPVKHADFKKALGQPESWAESYPDIEAFKTALTQYRDAMLLGRIFNATLHAPLTDLMSAFPSPQVLTLSAHLESLGAQLAGTLTHIHTLNQTVAKQEIEIKGLKATLGHKVSDLAQLTKSHRQLMKNAQTLESAASASTHLNQQSLDKISTLTSDLRKSLLKIKRLETESDQLRHDLFEAEDKEEASQDTLSRFQQQVASLTSDLTEAQISLEAQEETFKDLLSGLQTSLEEVKGDVTAVKAEKAKLLKEVTDIAPVKELNRQLVERMKEMKESHDEALRAQHDTSFATGAASRTPLLAEAEKRGFLAGEKATKAALNGKYREMQKELKTLKDAKSGAAYKKPQKVK